MDSNELLLRRLLWIRHGHPESIYGDDGEMQCGECLIDFKRMTPQEIESAFIRIGYNKIAKEISGL